MNIDKRIKYILVVDIETANTTQDAFAYDIGFAVADKKGNIYEKHSYMLAEMFLDHKDLMQSAYYAEKIPKYWKGFHKGERQLRNLAQVRSIIGKVMAKYNITDVYAYNCGFDSMGLNTTQRYLTKSKFRWFFPYGTQFHCIWHMACQVICTQKSYLKFCAEEGYYSEKGNVKTDAETVYKYMVDEHFEEVHMGIEDVEIECQILAKCYAQHKKLDTKIYRACWRIPQKDFKEFYKKVLTNK